MNLYRSLIRPLLFLVDPERVHYMTFYLLEQVCRTAPGRALLHWLYARRTPDLPVTAFGLRFPNPVGLAAGFDKNGLLTAHWRLLGFGFVEVGTVTPRPQPGNPTPRLFRLPADQAVINRMGFNNAGADALAARLRNLDKGDLIVGANIGKNKDTPDAGAAQDYLTCFEKLADYVDYIVVNVSSPNTPGLRTLQEKEPLTHILTTLQAANQARPKPLPILLKIAPDLTEGQLDDIVAVTQATGLAGIIATNTTISREGLDTPAAAVTAIGAGGLSGRPVRTRAEAVLTTIRTKTKGQLSLIGVGGIMTGADAQARMAAGAELIQVYTGFVYAGPGMARELVTALRNSSKPGQ
ncbi:MAG: quinone-dependent dihydroorotate dehydrogenase [Bacteroidia bacterium]|nr:quinone-dependent dihydroorotate dehydrogenase [Bacteroidia bacterium]